MLRRLPARETLIEQIYREVFGVKMPGDVKLILLKPPKLKPKPSKHA